MAEYVRSHETRVRSRWIKKPQKAFSKNYHKWTFIIYLIKQII